MPQTEQACLHSKNPHEGQAGRPHFERQVAQRSIKKGPCGKPSAGAGASNTSTLSASCSSSAHLSMYLPPIIRREGGSFPLSRALRGPSARDSTPLEGGGCDRDARRANLGSRRRMHDMADHVGARLTLQQPGYGCWLAGRLGWASRSRCVACSCLSGRRPYRAE